jgi:hypothetical protein
MTTKLVWRLSKLPTTSEITELVLNKIITQEEAREILLKTEKDEERDSESLKSEIKFLRELVENISKNNRTVVTEYIYKYPSYNYSWIQPYISWCTNTGLTGTSYGTTTSGNYINATNANYVDATGNVTNASGSSDSYNFAAISTFN